MDITSQIVENIEGGTVSLEGRDLPTTGYFVGGVVSPLVLPGDFLVASEIDYFVSYLTLDGNVAEYVGWWTDSDDGKLYIDGTTWHADYDEAERICRERNEIAFWDIERAREFRPVVLADKEV